MVALKTDIGLSGWEDRQNRLRLRKTDRLRRLRFPGALIVRYIFEQSTGVNAHVIQTVTQQGSELILTFTLNPPLKLLGVMTFRTALEAWMLAHRAFLKKVRHPRGMSIEDGRAALKRAARRRFNFNLPKTDVGEIDDAVRKMKD